MDQLPKCAANNTPLTPITFLYRAASVYADRTSVVYNNTRFTWKQTYDRCLRLASSLRSLNVSKNDVVSVLAPNVPALYEMHFAVPMAGAVLNAINTRLNAGNIAAILRHAEPRIFFIDYQYIRLARDALNQLMTEAPHSQLPLIVVIDDVDAPTGIRLGELDYESLVASGNPAHPPQPLDDECNPIALNYTSGTTADPKGVVYSHRGSYLSTLALLLHWEVSSEPVYLWSLPMFHCNGWTFTWGMAARGGTNICIRGTTAGEMYSAIVDHQVTHMCCAPTIFNILLDAAPAEQRPLGSKRVHVLTGGAPPPAAVLERVEAMGFHVTHAYGLTEATGPAMVCEWRDQWDRLPAQTRAGLKARQGVSVLSLADADVKDPGTLASVPRDGRTMGEIVLRGSSIMLGYYKNEEENKKALKDGWLWTGDMGVVHPDGYVEIKDRSKDVIISGGENISSIEVEAVLCRHQAVAEAAVVAMPHPYWGETPCAFVVLGRGYGVEDVKEEDIFAHCRSGMAGFMVPKRVVFVAELPKTGTGKFQKDVLREAARRLKPAEGKKRGPAGGGAAPVGKGVEVANHNSNNGRSEPQEQVMAISRL